MIRRREFLTGAATLAGTAQAQAFGFGGLGAKFGSLGVLGGARASDVTFKNKVGVVPYTNASTAGLTAFDSFFGRSSDYMMVFATDTSWTNFDNSIGNLISAFAGDPRPKIWTIGPNVVGSTLDDAAAGLFNSHYLAAAQSIFADAPATGFILVRIGHEFNIGGNYPWEVIVSGKAPQFKAAFRQVVGQFRSVSPRFRFIWCPNWLTSPNNGYDLTQAYPGDDVVDVVGTDLYYSSNTDNANPAVAWAFQRDNQYSVAWIVNFAKQRRKAFAMCECGTNWDRPQWFDLWYAWLQANGGFAWATLWDSNAQSTMMSRLSDSTKQYCGDRFIQLFKNGGPAALLEDTFYWGQPTNEGNGAFGATGAATLAITSSVYPSFATVTNGSNFADCIRQNLIGLTPGQTYHVAVFVNGGTLNAKIDVQDNTSTFAVLGSQVVNTANALQLVTVSFVPIGTSVYLRATPYQGNAAQVVHIEKVLLFAN